MEDYGLDKDELEDEHVRVRPPWRTICAALSLLLVGIVSGLAALLPSCVHGPGPHRAARKQGLFATSMSFYATGHDGATAFLVLSIIVLIPGSYASFQLYGAYRRWPGYEFSTVPSYELV